MITVFWELRSSFGGKERFDSLEKAREMLEIHRDSRFAYSIWKIITTETWEK